MFVNLTFWLFAIVSTICLINYRWKWRKLYEAASKIPVPPAYPIIGNALLFLSFEDIVENFEKILRQHGRTIGIWAFTVFAVVISKPSHIQIVLNSPSCSEKEKRYEIIKEALGDCLLVAKGNSWNNRRKILDPTFGHRILVSFMDVFVNQSEILVQQLEKELNRNGHFDVQKYLAKCSLDIISETAMGTKVHAQTTNSKFSDGTRKLSQILMGRLFRIWLHPNIIFRLSKIGREYKIAWQYARKYIEDILMERWNEARAKKQQLIFDDNEKRPFLSHLLALNKLTTEQLISEVALFMSAGTDTVAAATAYTLVCLGIHKDIQEKIYDELDEIFGDSDRSITINDLPKLVYLTKVIKEAMRIFPPIPFIARNVAEDVDIGDYIIPAGSALIVAIVGIHRDPDIYPDPMKFDPERFSPEEVAKRHPYSYIPFSAGPKHCIDVSQNLMGSFHDCPKLICQILDQSAERLGAIVEEYTHTETSNWKWSQSSQGVQKWIFPSLSRILFFSAFTIFYLSVK